MSPQLEEFYTALNRYSSLLRQIRNDLASTSRSDALNLLCARDIVESYVTELKLGEEAKIPARVYARLKKLDALLKILLKTSNFSDVVACTSSPRHSSEDHNSSGWWWKHNQSTEDTDQEALKLLYQILSFFYFVTLVVALAIIGNIVSKLLLIRPDITGAMIISLQSVLAIVASKVSFDSFFNLQSETPVERYFVRESGWKRVLGLSPILAFLISILIYLNLSQISNLIYISPGKDLFLQRRFINAELALKRGLSLDPLNARGHYFVGLIHEEIGNLKDASSEYLLAATSGWLPAENNLARLNLLMNHDGLAYSALQRADAHSRQLNKFLSSKGSLSDITDQEELNLLPQSSYLHYAHNGFEELKVETDIIRVYIEKNLAWLYLKEKFYEKAISALKSSEESNIIAYDNLSKLDKRLRKSVKSNHPSYPESINSMISCLGAKIYGEYITLLNSGEPEKSSTFEEYLDEVKVKAPEYREIFLRYSCICSSTDNLSRPEELEWKIYAAKAIASEERRKECIQLKL